MLDKPKRIANDEFQSEKWDEITRGRNFKPSDIPNIAMLCQWYAVAETCMNDITDEAGVHVAYTNDVGDIKAFPQLASMKQASAEIRALNKQLGINDERREEEEHDDSEQANILTLITKQRTAGAANTKAKVS